MYCVYGRNQLKMVMNYAIGRVYRCQKTEMMTGYSVFCGKYSKKLLGKQRQSLI